MTKAYDYLTELQKDTDKNAYYLKLAFLSAIMELKSRILYDENVLFALESDSESGILDSTNIDILSDLLSGIGIDKDTFIFSDEIQKIVKYGAMGAFYQLSQSKQKLWNFDPIGERVVSYLRNDALRFASEVTENTREGVRLALSQIVPQNKLQTGRIVELQQSIGLTGPQAQAVINFRRQLETRSNLGVTPPDQRLLSILDQRVIANHMKNNTLTPAAITEKVQLYYESLLNKRANDIANTEAMSAVNAGQQLLWEQGLDQGIFSDITTRKFWQDMGDGKVRPTHRVIAGMNLNGVKIRSMFLTPFGLVYGPQDRNSNLINCRCMIYIKEVTN